MPAPKQEKQDNQASEGEKQKRLALNALIGQQIVHTMPSADLQRVQVKHLWENRYRVNVLVGDEASSVRVSDSYFLVADSEGKILACNPPLRVR